MALPEGTHGIQGRGSGDPKREAAAKKAAATRKANAARYQAMVEEAEKVLFISWFDGVTLERVLNADPGTSCDECGKELNGPAWVGVDADLAFCHKGCITRARRSNIIANADKQTCARCRRPVDTTADFILDSFGLWHDACRKAGPRKGSPLERAMNDDAQG